MIYLVSYDLKTPGKDYQAVYEVLKGAPGWWHHLESTWVISTNESISTWTDRIRKIIDANDSFIIVEITGQPRSGWLLQKAWDWLKQHDSK